jgi:hypothetical protein
MAPKKKQYLALSRRKIAEELVNVDLRYGQQQELKAYMQTQAGARS